MFPNSTKFTDNSFLIANTNSLETIYATIRNNQYVEKHEEETEKSLLITRITKDDIILYSEYPKVTQWIEDHNLVSIGDNLSFYIKFG